MIYPELTESFYRFPLMSFQSTMKQIPVRSGSSLMNQLEGNKNPLEAKKPSSDAGQASGRRFAGWGFMVPPVCSDSNGGAPTREIY